MARGFDLETDGLYDDVTRIHCLVIKDTDTGEVWRFRQNSVMNTIEEGLRFLAAGQSAECPLVAHNGIKYDIAVIRKLYPWFTINEDWMVDTMIVTRLIYPDLWDTDAKLHIRGHLPGNLKNRHSLEAWGFRLASKGLVNVLKSDYDGDPTIADEDERKARKWERWNEAMETYCVQDVEVCCALFLFLIAKDYSAMAIRLEHDVAWIIARQERYGFLFDQERAAQLYSMLVKRRLELEAELKVSFLPFYQRDGKLFTPKRDNGPMGYTAGAPITKLKLVEFNPGSRDHIANRLTTLFGWEPLEFTDDGKPKVDETVLASLNYPQAALLREYFVVDKRIGQVAEGNEAWLKRVGKDGRMHGSVNTNGAVTGRMTHSHPNMGQVPANHSPYGEECRACFIVPKGKVLVGADADALELRDLAGYMAAYDGGAYIEVVLRGDKKQGTDMHSVNCRALGMDPKVAQFTTEDTTGRDVAKTWFYAFIYGAGDEKLGVILIHVKGDPAKKRGGKSRKDFLANLPALGQLVKAVKAKVKSQKFLKGLDGRRLQVRSQHAALNTLLQSAGAVQMKMALVILDRDLKAMGLVPGVHYEFVANVHDEWQIEVDEDKGDIVGKAAVEAIRKAGEVFSFRCPLAGEYKIGRNWAETH